jgi:hypothetical protein
VPLGANENASADERAEALASLRLGRCPGGDYGAFSAAPPAVCGRLMVEDPELPDNRACCSVPKPGMGSVVEAVDRRPVALTCPEKPALDMLLRWTIAR